jgi:hypothetical protein
MGKPLCSNRKIWNTNAKMESLDLVPEAICLIDRDDFTIQHANSRFCCTVAPLSKFRGLDFLQNFISKEDQSRFQEVLRQVIGSQVLSCGETAMMMNSSANRNIAMLQDMCPDPCLQTYMIQSCSTLTIGPR